MLRRKGPALGRKGHEDKYHPQKKWIQGTARNRCRFGMQTLLICAGGVACCFSVFFIILRFCLPSQFNPDRLIATEKILLQHANTAVGHGSRNIELFQTQVQIEGRGIPHQNQKQKLSINTVHVVHRTKRPNNGKSVVLLHGVCVLHFQNVLDWYIREYRSLYIYINILIISFILQRISESLYINILIIPFILHVLCSGLARLDFGTEIWKVTR